jgi:hypothetical protein
MGTRSLSLAASPQQRKQSKRGSAGRIALWQSVMFAGFLSFTLALYFMLLSVVRSNFDDSDLVRLLIIIGHLTAIGGFAWLISRFARIDPILLLTPAAGFLFCCAIFFGFGGLATIMVDDLTRSLMSNDAYMLDEAEQLRANVAIFAGSTLVYLSMNVGRFVRKNSNGLNAHITLRRLSLLTVIFGLLLKFGVLLPVAWGYLDWVVPGVLGTLAQLPDVGFLLMAIAIARGDRKITFWFAWLWIPHLAICLVEFSKTSTVFALLMPALGALIGGIAIRRILPLFVFAGIVFMIAQNVNTRARNYVEVYSGVENQAPITVRVGALGEAISNFIVEGSGGYEAVDEAPPQQWWVRLNYSGPLIRAMEAYDLGQSGTWNVAPLHYVIPRILWPSKPALENAGLAFNRQITRNDTTSGRVAITIFGEGYWIAGWSGLTCFSILVGLIIGMIMRYSLGWLEMRNYIYFPVSLIAFNIGLVGVLDFFQTSFLGSTSIFIALSVLTRFTERLFIAKS